MKTLRKTNMLPCKGQQGASVERREARFIETLLVAASTELGRSASKSQKVESLALSFKQREK